MERGGYGEEESTLILLVSSSSVVTGCGATVLKFRFVFIVRKVEGRVDTLQ